MRKRKGLVTVFFNESRVFKAQLYDTVIFQSRADSITLNSGGFKTNHTKNCINDLLPSGFRLYQKDFEWLVDTPYTKALPFIDNMELHNE